MESSRKEVDNTVASRERRIVFLIINLSFDLLFFTTQKYLTRAVANLVEIWRNTQIKRSSFLEKKKKSNKINTI